MGIPFFLVEIHQDHCLALFHQAYHRELGCLILALDFPNASAPPRPLALLLLAQASG